MSSKGRSRTWAVAGPLMMVLVATTSIPLTTSSYVATHASPQSVGAAPVVPVGLVTAQAAYLQHFSVTGLTPGSSTDLLITLQNDGTSGIGAVDLAVATATATSLDTDATNGLQVRVDACATRWDQPISNGPASCAGPLTTLLGPMPLATAANASPSAQVTSGLATFAAGGRDHLRVRFMLTSTAPNGWSSLTSSPTLSIWAVGPPSAPTAVTATAGDGQTALTWSPPTTTYGYPVTGYTATAAPGGATCSSSGSSCTTSGLVNGVAYAVTVTATNTWGTGAPSAAVSTIPYPALVLSAGPGMTLWLDGADTATMLGSSSCTGSPAAAGANIGCWKDKSTVGENFIQATAAAQPVRGSLGPFAATNFTSSTEVLESVNASNSYRTVLIVTAPATTPSGFDYLFGLAGGDFSIRMSYANDRFSNGNNQDWSGNTGSPQTAWTNGAQAVSPTYGSNQVVIVTAASGWTNTFSASVSSTYFSQGHARGMMGPVGEVIAFSGTLTAAQRRTVENYLSRKWAVTITPDEPSSVTASVASTTSVTASWTAPAYNGGSAVTGYVATASPGGATCTTTTATTCAITGLTHGTSYTATVSATNPAGTGPASAASASVTP